MKVSYSMTLDGLVRALQGRAHTLADEIEAGYRRGRVDSARLAGKVGRERRNGGDDDAVAGD